MKYFTREWLSSDLSNTDRQAVQEAYQRHRTALMPLLPALVAELAQTNLHDSLIRQVIINRLARTLHLALRCGDRQQGYFDLDITYLDCELTTDLRGMLAERAHDQRTEILYDEIDCTTDGRFVHRLLCWPEGEITITFAQLELRRIAQPSRKFDRNPHPYIET